MTTLRVLVLGLGLLVSQFAAVAQPQFNTIAQMTNQLVASTIRNAMTIRVLGYYEAGDWGAPKEFRWSATNTLDDAPVNRILTTNVIGRLVMDWDGDASAFGVLTSSTNIAPELTAALSYACTRGKRVWLRPGYYTSRNFQFTNNCEGICLDLGDAEIGTTTNSAVIWFKGHTNSIVTDLAASTTESSQTISVVSAASFTIGDWILIYEDTSNTGVPFHDGVRMEHNLIVDIAGNVLTLGRRLRWDYRTNFSTKIYGMVGPRNPTIIRGKLSVPRSETNTVSAGGLRLENLTGANVLGLQTERCGADGGILLYRSGNCTVESSHFRFGRGIDIGGNGYGMIVYGCHDIKVLGGSQLNTRESAVSYSIYVTFDSFDSDSTFDSGINTHGALAKHVVFRNCNVNQSGGIGFLASFSGSVTYDESVTIENCTVWSAKRQGIAVFASAGNRVRGVTVRNCKIRNSDINVNGTGALYMGNLIDGNISGCEFVDGPALGTPIIFATNCIRLQIKDCLIRNNRNTSTYGLRADGCIGLDLSGLTFRDNRSLTRAISILDSFRVTIDKCTFGSLSEMPTRLTTGAAAIGVGGITDLRITGNKFIGYFTTPITTLTSTNGFTDVFIEGNQFPPDFTTREAAAADSFGSALVGFRNNRAGVHRDLGSDVLGVLYGANLNTTNAQAIPIDAGNAQIDRIVLTDASTSLSNSPLVGIIATFPDGSAASVVTNLVVTNLITSVDVADQTIATAFSGDAGYLGSAAGASSPISSNVIVYNGHSIRNGQTVQIMQQTENGLPRNVYYSPLTATNVTTDSFRLAPWRGADPYGFLPCARKAVTINPSWDLLMSTAHGYTNGDRLWFTGDDTPIGIAAYPVTYTVTNAASDTFQISSNGTVVNIGSEGYNVLANKSSLLAATFDAGTDVFTFAENHIMSANAVFAIVGTAPTQLVSDRKYFAVNVTPNTLQASATAGGPAIDGLDAGSFEITKDYVAPMVRPGFGLRLTTAHGSAATATVIVFGQVRK